MSTQVPRIALVLGAAVRPDGSPSPALVRRTNAAIALWKNGAVDQVMLCGGVAKAGVTEALAMQALCVDQAIPKSALILEDQSRTTRENFAFAAALLPQDAEIMIVTDRYHAWRAKLLAAEYGIGAPVVVPDAPIQSVQGYLRAYLREAAALIKYATQRLFRLISKP